MILIDSTAFLAGIDILMNWSVLFYIILGLIVGIVLGALPGVSGVIGVAITLPLTYQMNPIDALMFLTGIFTGSVYGSGVTAILLNIPGGPAAVATTFDGYEMTRQGRQNEALGIGLGASAIGAFLSYLAVLFFIQPLGKLVLKFGAPEMLMLTIFAFSVIGAVQGNFIKVLIAGVLGLLIGTIGATAFGNSRGTFGQAALYEGIELVPAIMGLLAVTELFFLVKRDTIADDVANVQRNFLDILKGLVYPLKDKINSLRSMIIGLFVGLLPAAGGTVAALMSYGQAQVYSKNRERFGKGEPSGIVAAETANSSSEGGSMTTMMTFGIPGGSVTAVLMAGFMVHGLTPGPYLIRDHMDMAYAVIIGNMIQMFFLVILGVVFIWYFSRIVLIPSRILIPIIGLLAVLGALSIREVYIDAILILIFAFLGYIMRRLDYPVIALLLGMILGGIADGELTRTLIMFDGRYWQILERPIVMVMLVLTFLMLFIPLIRKLVGYYSAKNS